MKIGQLALLSASILFICFIYSCSKSSPPKEPLNNLHFTIASITPVHGGFGTIDTITGDGFDQVPAMDSIVINGKHISVISKSTTQIIVSIPTLAGTGNIVLWSGGASIKTPVFNYDTLIVVTTLAGSGNGIVADGKGLNASFNAPQGMTIGPGGNIFVIDNYFSCIRKITPDGTVTTLAGQPGSGVAYGADGQGTNAGFNRAEGITCDVNGNLYVSDYLYVRKVTPSGMVSTIAGHNNFGSQDGTGANVGFNQPSGMTIDKNMNVYVGDEGSGAIRKITPDGHVSTLLTNTKIDLRDITIDNAGAIYVANSYYNNILKVSPDIFSITILAGISTPGYMNGPGNIAQFTNPARIAIGPDGFLYELDNTAVRKIDPNTGFVSTYAGGGAGNVDGPVPYATFRSPLGIAIDSIGNIYIADAMNNNIRKIEIR